MAAAAKGICPNCESRTGPIGENCPSDVCSRKGYRFIPTDWHEAARTSAIRKQRALDPLLGRTVDRYLLAGKIGEGGMGAVYLALQRPLDREVALKIISGLDLTQTTVARFEREARAISVLDHPNVVKLYDYGIGELEFRVPYMALEYVRHGKTLRRAFSQIRDDNQGRIPGQVVRTIFEQVLHALGTAHDLGIIHRDMKPDNVMIAPVRGNATFVKVLDFGLAKAVSEVSGFDGDVSRTGQFLGTPFYMAPEQGPRKGTAEVDGRADLYAVAVMLFEVFTGARPFDGDTPLEVLAKKVDPTQRPLDIPAAQGLPRGLQAFLAKGLSVDRNDRFANATEMLEAFDRALSGRTTAAMGLPGADPTSSHDRAATPPSPAAQSSPITPVERGVGKTPLPAQPPFGAEDVRSTLEPGREAAARRRLVPWLVALIATLGGLGAIVGLAAAPTSTEPPVERAVAAAAPPAAGEPQAARALDPAAAQAVATQAHSLVVRSVPPGARIRVDGREIGTSPASYRFDAGSEGDLQRTAEVVASLPGFEESRTSIRLEKAVGQGRIDVVLTPIPSRIEKPKAAPRRQKKAEQVPFI